MEYFERTILDQSGKAPALRAFLCLFVYSLISFSSLSQADIVLIGSSDVPKLDKRSAKMVFMKKVTSFSNGVKAQPLDLPDDNDVKWKFYKSVVGKKPAQVNSYWSRALFTGAGEPPEEVGSEGEMISRINAGSGIIGYVDERYVTSDMNVLYRVSD